MFVATHFFALSFLDPFCAGLPGSKEAGWSLSEPHLSSPIATSHPQPSPPLFAKDTDAQLLASAANGDDGAFRRLVERHQGRLLRTAERLLGDPAEAEDIVQEGFFAAYTKAAYFEPGGEVGAWLYRIVVNACLKRLRRRRLLRFISADLSRGDRFLEPPAHSPTPLRQLEARERWRKTRALIDSLPVGQRVVLVLARFEGLSLKAIGDILGISEKAAESRLARAIDRLRRAERAQRSRP